MARKRDSNILWMSTFVMSWSTTDDSPYLSNSLDPAASEREREMRERDERDERER